MWAPHCITEQFKRLIESPINDNVQNEATSLPPPYLRSSLKPPISTVSYLRLIVSSRRKHCSSREARGIIWVMDRNLLITGLPGTGKTTLVMKLADRLKGVRAAGFYTEEIRTGWARLGFEIVDLRGGRTLLSHIDIPGGRRVGKYGVDVAAFEQYLESVPFLSPHTDLAVVDEIGKMECLSEKFTRLIVNLLDAPIMVVATIALRGEGIIDRIKRRANVRLYWLTKENRDSLVEEIETAVRQGLARPGL